MKRKVLCTLLCVSMTAAMAAGCGSGASSDAGNSQAADGSAESSGSTADGSADAGDAGDIDYGSGTVTIWVAENVVNFTKQAAEEFLASDSAYSGYTVQVEPVGEGDAAGNMITDVEGGADLFGFAQDQIARLVSAGAVQPIVGDYATWVQEENDEGAADAATVGDMMYAFPLTADNGYFMYYDSSVITDPTSLEKIIEDCEAAGKNFYMEINSGWYQTAFFFATGCGLSYETDSDGKFISCTADYASEKGLVALKEMIELASSSSFQNGSSIGDGTNVAAIIDGTWDAEAAKSLFGDNYACAKLPSFEGSDGATYQMSGFSGYKLMGIKPQEDAGKLQLCYKLAQYLTSTEVQLARYEEVGWGPSNLAAQQDEAVQEDEALSALREQLEVDVLQGDYPDAFWTLSTSFGDDVRTGTLNASSSDDELMAALQTFQDTCISYAQ